MKSSRSLMTLIGVVFLALCLAGHSTARVSPAEIKRLQKVEDPHKEAVVFVEAFMVEVPLEEIHDLGVPVISEGAESVSVEHILKCLEKPDAASVTAGARLAASQRSESSGQTNIRRGYFSGPPEDKNLQYEDFGTSLIAQAEVLHTGRISVQFKFSHEGLEEPDDDAEPAEWPAIVRRQWSGRLYLEPGKPTLAGATQDEETAVFLIITAAINK